MPPLRRSTIWRPAVSAWQITAHSLRATAFVGRMGLYGITSPGSRAGERLRSGLARARRLGAAARPGAGPAGMPGPALHGRDGDPDAGLPAAGARVAGRLAAGDVAADPRPPRPRPRLRH